MEISDDELPLDHPLLRPEQEVCFVSRDEEMDAEEACLSFALLAASPDGRCDIPLEDAHRAFSALPDVVDTNILVHRFTPECFLIIFSTQRSRDAALRAASVPIGAARRLLRPWTRLVRADSLWLHHRVLLELEGIPAHALSMCIARKLLAFSCWIEKLEPSADKSILALTAWTDMPKRIPRTKVLHIAEHEVPVVYDDPVMQRVFGNLPPYLREKKVLKYNVLIHQRRIADFNSRSPSPLPGLLCHLTTMTAVTTATRAGATANLPATVARLTTASLWSSGGRAVLPLPGLAPPRQGGSTPPR
jgi:hypothetical protein